LQYTENIGFSEFTPHFKRLDRVAELGRLDRSPKPCATRVPGLAYKNKSSYDRFRS
jgi:hypothetical protein